MGVSISGLPAASTLGDDDIFEVEQAGVSKKVTKAQLASLVFPDAATYVALDISILPQNGDVIANNGTDWHPGKTPRWRVIHQNAYTESAVASSSTITFAGGGPTDGIYLKAGDYFSVGDPVRVVISATSYYGICTAVTDTLLTIAGAILPTATAIDSVSVGSKDMVKNVRLLYPDTGYNASSTLVLAKGCLHRWHGATGYLCLFAASHMNTSATTVINLQMNGGSDVTASGLTLSSGTVSLMSFFAEIANGTLIAANVAIAHNQTITVKTPTVGGAADFLIVNLTFVVP